MGRRARGGAPAPSVLARFVRPFEAFFRAEAAGGVAVAVASVAALLLANSRWADAFAALWATPVAVGAQGLGLTKTLHHWVDDLVMALFFLVVGLELKRELVVGELSSVRKALLPGVAAVGGMLVPALLFKAVAGDGPAAPGWGVPMATDIAFALAAVRLLGARVPPALVVFLAALAIFDDLGAIVVIAVFYAGDLSPTAHALAALVTLGLVGLNVAGVSRPAWYVLLGVPLWLAVLKSGVHATLAGVVVGLCVPARARAGREEVLADARALLDAAGRAGHDQAEVEGALEALRGRLDEVESPAARLERALHPLVAFGVVPLFALANAGVSFAGVRPGDLADPACLGVVLGLLVGKPVGVVGATWAAVRAGLAPLPTGATWRHIVGLGFMAGIGFTMSLFVAALAFPEGSALHRAAKLGTLLASCAAGAVGVAVLRAGAATDASTAGVVAE